MELIKTLQQAIVHFADAENCRKFMIEMRWLDGVVRCPYCNSEKVTWLANAKVYRCYGDHAKQKFSLKIGTIFEDSAIGLEKWLPATWLLCNSKNGISSYELARAIGVTQKSAWFMLHRIRLAMRTRTFIKLGGPGTPVEVDETYVGGKAKNMHRNKIAEKGIKQGQGAKKVAVMGMLDRDSRQVRAKVIPNSRREVLQKEILETIEKGSTVYTDQWGGYHNLSEKQYVHETVDHLTEYVRARFTLRVSKTSGRYSSVD